MSKCREGNTGSEKPISSFSTMFPPKAKWTSDDVPDLTGQTIIVTGGSSGIGKETCRVLLLHGARVYIAARSKDKATRAVDELIDATGNDKCFFLMLDLADLVQIRRAAEEFTGKEDKLHVLFNNGGVMTPPLDQLTAQGYDVQFGVNMLGHFFFTKLLLPLLIKTAESSPSHVSRIITTSSDAADSWTVPGGIDFGALQRDEVASKARKKLGVQKLYGQSKLANNLFATELARRHGNQGIYSLYVHPGYIETDLQRHLPSAMRTVMKATILKPVEDGAINQLYAGTSSDALKTNGQYFIPWARPTVPRNPEAGNSALAEKLWDWCEEQIKRF